MLDLNIGGIIKRTRKSAGMSQRNFSRVFHLDQATISRIERGEQNISFNFFITFLEHFEIPVNDFLKDSIDYDKIKKYMSGRID